MDETYPLCFETEGDFNTWVSSAVELGIEDAEYNFCLDCLPAYQLLAKRNGVCVSPQTFFVPFLDDDGEEELIGIRP